METQTLMSLTAVGLFFILIFDFFYKHFTFWQRQGLPSHRFITTGWAKKPFFEFAEDTARRFAPHKIYGAYGPFNKILIVNDAKIVRELSTKAMHKFPIRNSQLDQGTTNIRKSLFFMQANEDWKRIRSIVTPAFTSGKLKRMMSPIERIAENFIEHLHQEADTGKTFDLKKYINGFAMDVIACCGYGVEIDSVRDPNHPVVVNATKILNVDVTITQIICFLFPKVAKWFKLDIFDKDAVNYFDKLTFEIVEKRLKEADGKQKSDLLGLMIEESGENKFGNLADNPHTKALKGISPDELSGQGILFFIAGYDTSNATFDHCIFYLTQYPEWQEKLYQELNAVKDELDYDKLKHLKILNA
ncbi:PREDICTED: cytochrome P450 3A8-like, partial [Rhagoletis zephyria]|uniref:cytochrome P450 3A8-like n=1 Tax=Rhagoletis zephyria TaxID=28612 RepID=UPI000811292D